MKTITRIGIATLIIVVFSLFVNAFGVSSSYWKDNPLIMHSGQTEDVKLLLQNMVGEKDMKVKISIVEGNTIAKLLDKSDTYNIPFGVKDVPINIRITIPENAKIGNNLNVGVMILSLPEISEQPLVLTGSILQNIPIEIESDGSSDKSVNKKEKGFFDFIWDLIIYFQSFF